jgi:phage shock protein PspC (stress-responsive transcriptional regulator)
MPDEAADKPADTGAEPSQDAAAPTASIPTPPPPPPPYGGAPLGDEAPRGTHTPPGPTPPPWFGAGAPSDGNPFFSRQGLIRPTQGRYLAGVCAAIGRATNTDPVLWRVVLAVLGFFGGIGLLIYLIGWLLIPAEGDTASPIEGLLGRGRSAMSPLAVLILGGATAITFAFIVDSGFRSAMLVGALVVGGLLLYKRHHATGGGLPFGLGTPSPGFPGAPQAPTPPTPPYAAAPTQAPQATTAPADEPVTAPLPPFTSQYAAAPPYATTPPPPPLPPTAPPGGYRPPFAPHGPYAGPQQAWRNAPPPVPKPPKPPRERSKLGRITFFMMFVAIGLVAVLDLGGVGVHTSTYFAAALVTISLGLVVGAWFGRARGLIALALLASIGLAGASATERWGVAGLSDPVLWQPKVVTAVADSYSTPVGDATLDLRQVDFTGQNQVTSVEMSAGKLRVLLPPKVDVTSIVELSFGSVKVLGQNADGADLPVQTVKDLGPDGAGGGTLELRIQMDAGDVEVTR